jgi:hypothetical protein
MHKNLVV